MRAGLEMEHEMRFLYKYLSKRVAEAMRLKRKVLRKAMLAHICREGPGVIPGFSKERPMLADGSFPGIPTPTCDYSSSSFSPPSLQACFGSP